jgi:hypothetical protein
MRLVNLAPEGYSHIQLKYGPYSASRLIVARCPARFESKYVRKDKIVSDTVASARGSAVHYVFEMIGKVRAEGKVPTRAQIDTWLSEAATKHPAAYSEIKMVMEATNAYLANPSPYANNSTITEKELAVALYVEDSFMDDVEPNRVYVPVPYTLEGKPNRIVYLGAKIDQMSIDTVARVVTVLDHKTTPSASESGDINFQMGCYAWLAKLHYPEYSIRTVVHFANPALNFYAAPYYWSSEDLQDMDSEIRTRIRFVESISAFPALPGGHCDYCHMSTDCPELNTINLQNAKHAINTNVNGVQDLVELAKKVRVLGVVYDELNKVLKKGVETYCPENGIAIEGLSFNFRSSESVDWDATEEAIAIALTNAEAKPVADRTPLENTLVECRNLKGIMVKFGLNPEGFRDWKNDKMKAVWRLDKEEFIKLISSVAVKEKTTRWGAYKH